MGWIIRSLAIAGMVLQVPAAFAQEAARSPNDGHSLWYAHATPVVLPDVITRLRSFGVYEHGGTPKALEDFIVLERRLWEKTVRLAKIEPE